MNDVNHPAAGARVGLQDSVKARAESRAVGFRVGGAEKSPAEYTLAPISAEALRPDNAVYFGGEETVLRAAPAFAFRLAHAIERPAPSIADIVAAIDFVLPAATIDDGAQASVLLGSEPRSLSAANLRLCGTCMEKNGEPVAFGAGASAGGNPLGVVSWAAGELWDRDCPLKSGDLIVVGGLSDPVDARPDDWIRISINRLGSITFRMERAR